MTETRFYEPTRLSTPPKPLFSLKPLDATTWFLVLFQLVPAISVHKTPQANDVIKFKTAPRGNYGKNRKWKTLIASFFLLVSLLS